MLAFWLLRRKRQGKPTLIDPDLFQSSMFQLGITQQMLQQIALGGTMIALPIYLQMVLEYNAMEAGLSIAPLSLSMFAIALLAGKRAGRRRPSNIVLVGFAALVVGLVAAGRDRPARRLRLVPRRAADDRRLGTRPARLPAQQLHAVADLGGAGQRGRGGQLGVRVVRPVVRARVRRRDHAGHALDRLHRPWPSPAPCCLRPSNSSVADVLEDDAQVMTNTQLEELLVGQPEAIQDEILRINADARPLALQVALLVPILAGVLGCAERVPDEAAARPGPIQRRRGDGTRLRSLRGLLRGSGEQRIAFGAAPARQDEQRAGGVVGHLARHAPEHHGAPRRERARAHDQQVHDLRRRDQTLGRIVDQHVELVLDAGGEFGDGLGEPASVATRRRSAFSSSGVISRC